MNSIKNELSFRLIKIRYFNFSAWLSICLFTLLSVSAGLGAEETRHTAPNTLDAMVGKIAFSALSNEFWQIHTLNLLTGETRQITKTLIDKRSPTWYPNGERVAYRTTAGTIEVIDLEAGTIQNLAPTLGFLVDPRLSSSGESIAFARFESDLADNTDLYSYNFLNKSLLHLTSTTILEYAPSWSPDEHRIAFISGRGSKGHFLSVMDANGKNIKKLQDRPSDDMCPTWSPDGKWIAFASCITGDYEVWRIRPNGLEMQMLTNSPGLDSNPTFSPDGSRIAFTSNRGGLLRIWAMRADGSNPLPLTSNSMPARDPAWWSPPAKTDSKEGK